MPKFRLLLQRTPVTDPEAIARGAQALLDRGSQVRLLTPRLWVYTPLVADYRRVTVTWAGPGAQPPAGWTAGPCLNGVQLLYSDTDAAPPDPVDNRGACEARLAWLRTAWPKLVVSAVVFGAALAALRWLFPGDLPLFLANGLALGFTLLVLLVLILQLCRLAALRRLTADTRLAYAHGSPPPAMPVLPAPLRGLVLALLLLSLVLMGFGSPTLLGMALGVLVSVLLQRCWQFSLLGKGVSLRSARRRTAFLTPLVFGVLLVFYLAGALPGQNPSRPVQAASYDGGQYEIYTDSLPLELWQLEPDLSDKLLWSRRLTRSRSPLLTATGCRQIPANGSGYYLEYRILDTALPPVQALVESALLADHPGALGGTNLFGQARYDGYDPVDPTPWGARAAYRLHWDDQMKNQYLLCWPGRVVEILLDHAPNEAQMATVAAALAPNP